MKEALTTEISRGKRQTIRRAQKNPQEKKNIPKPKTKTSNGIGPWWQERWQKGWRRRTCEKTLLEKKNSSRAYNAAMKQAAREGKSPATCKTLAWPAHAKMASYIDSGVVKENYWAEIFTCGKSNGMVQCEHFSCQQCFWIKQIVTACDLTNKCLHLRHFVSVVASVTRSCFVLGLKLHLWF